jgi:AAA ATPase-like protein/AAA domain-containing protein
LLRELKLHRFKAFASEEKIPVRPITLIYGPNSSGKSSIIQSLLLLKQTMLEAENPNIPLLPKGKIVDLGGYRELVSGHEITQDLSFRLQLNSPKWYRNAPFAFGPYRGGRQRAEMDDVGMAFSFTYDESLESAILASVQVYLGEDDSPAVIFKPDTKQEGKTPEFYMGFDGSARSGQTTIKVDRANYEHRFWKDTWSARNAQYREQEQELTKKLNAQKKRLQQTDLDGDISEKAKSRLKKIEKDLEKIKNYTFSAAIKDFEKANRNTFLTCSNFLPNDLRVIRPESTEVGMDVFGYEPLPHGAGPLAALAVAGEIRRFLEAIVYIGPLREYPERHYIFSGNLANDVGKTGSMVPDILFKDSALLNKVNEHFESFEIGYRLEVASVGERRPELHDVFALRLVDRITGVNVSVVDVGFGISQVLPVIVQSMLSKKKTLLIEQPEIHLHPRLQSELAGLLCEAIREPYENEFVVETHSEHLILRLQRLIRSGQVRPTEISVVYVDRTPDGSRCIPIRLDSNGEFLDRWPGGFFEESYHEIFS